MALSNYAPGTENDPRAPWNETDDEQEHDRFCAVNTSGRRCDCNEDY